jgi:hypothetical protein
LEWQARMYLNAPLNKSAPMPAGCRKTLPSPIPPGSALVTLSDPFILYVHGAPLQAKVDYETGARITLAYQLKLPTDDQDRVRVGYRLSIYKADLTATIVGRPLSADNSFEAQGQCRKKR